MEYYSAFKRKEILTHATLYRNLEVAMLGEINQTQKEKYYMILFIPRTINSLR